MEMDQGPAERKLAGEKRTRSQAWPSDSIALVPQPQPEDTGVAPTTTLAVNEIFCRVRGYCLTREDKANLSCTNKAIRAAARDTTRSLDFSVNNTYRHRGITSAQLAEFIPKYAHAHIDHVNLSGCSLITDTGLQALAQHCTGLTELDLSSCALITDAVLRVLAQHCSGLTSLNLDRCRLITDAGLQALAQRCTGLTSLNLEWCSRITDAGLQALAQHCTGLTSLNLNRCRLITDAGVQALAQHCTGLTSLDLDKCRLITDAGVQALAQRCTGLTTLNLAGCRLITDAGLRALRQDYPHIRIFERP